MSEKVTVFVGTGSAPDPSPPDIVTRDYISAADVQALIDASIVAFKATLARSLMFFSGLFTAQAAATTDYYFVCDTSAANKVGTPGTPARQNGFTFEQKRTFKRVTARYSNTAGTANPIITDTDISLAVEGVDSALIVTMPAGCAAGFEATFAADVVVNVGETVMAHVHNVNGGTNSALFQITFEIDPVVTP